MASTINASTTSTSGLVQTADASGILQLQSNGVTGLTVSTGGNVTVNTDLFVSGSQVEPLVLGTAQTASGTNIDFTGIPSWVKRITVMFVGVSTSGTSDVVVQLGTVGGFATSGYIGSAITVVGGASPGASAYTTGFLIRMGGAATAAAVRHGVVRLERINENNWLGEVNVSLSNAVYWAGGSGSINANGTVTGLRITTVNGTDTFDAGTINIMYE